MADINTNLQGLSGNALIVDLENLESLTLQFNPPVLQYQPESDFIAVTSMGRNNPVYYFTGAEDTLEFNISWVSVSEDRKDVLTKVKWLEARTKNDGYINRVHRVKFLYGLMFTEAIWVITAAPYSLELMHKGYGMMPTLARQTLRLKRITENNSTRRQILDIYS